MPWFIFSDVISALNFIFSIKEFFLDLLVSLFQNDLTFGLKYMADYKHTVSLIYFTTDGSEVWWSW